MHHFKTLLWGLSLIATSAMVQQAADSQSKIYFIHANKFNGISSPFNVFIDDRLTCKLNNKHYSIHNIEPGSHTFSTYYSMFASGNNKAEKLTIQTEPGKIYYIQVIYQSGFYSAKLYCSEITENSAKPLMVKLEEDTDCL